MWVCLFMISNLFINGFSQVFEGSGGDSGDTIGERFVESSNDPSIITTSSKTCIEKPFAGLGFVLNGIRRNQMFICPNGLIRLNDGVYQNWPFNYGTLPTQQDDPSFAPYFAPVDLSAFATGQSKVRFKNHHISDATPNAQVFNRVNTAVRMFIGETSFSATWASVITWENIKPAESGNFGGRNQFQVVMVSNETCWFVMYNYADIDWSVPAPRVEYSQWVSAAGLPVMGLNKGRRGFEYRNRFQYENLPFSGTVDAEDIDDINGNRGTGRWIFDVSEKGPKSDELLCYEWFVSESPVVINSRLQCPPTSNHASRDRRFTQVFFFGTECYVNVFPISGSAVRCCYNRNLLKSKTSPGGVLSQNPLYFSTDTDTYGYQKCCLDTNLCDAYRRLRPKQKGRFYVRPRRAWGFGDPHYANMDGMNYTFNGCGEYMFLDGNSGLLQIQVKFTQVTASDHGTIISAVLIKHGGLDPIQVNLIKGGGMLFLQNGAEYSSSFSSTSTVLQNSFSITKSAANKISIMTEDNNWVEVTDEGNNLVLVMVLDDSLFGKTKGLLGNWTNNIDDDFLLPNGTILTSPLTDEQVHYEFGEEWRLTSNQNLFANTTQDMYFKCNANFTPIFITNFTFPNSSLQDTAKSLCGNDMDCLFDVAATGSLEFGQTTLDSINNIVDVNNQIGNNEPNFTVREAIFNMTFGETFSYTLVTSDNDGDDITVSVKGLPQGATFVQNGNEWTFVWNVNSIEPFNMTFIATDSKGASTSLVPIINMCACQNSGKCFKRVESVTQSQIEFDQFFAFDCQCPDNYNGRFCEKSNNFCDTASGSPCYPRVNCTNSLTMLICGPCPIGYSGDGEVCSDIDECGVALTNGCEDGCVNTPGSFECRCNDGHRLNVDKKNCDDINECLEGNDCMQNCDNNEGSFTCSCIFNFKTDPSNSKNCIPTNPCASNNNCQQVCFVDQINNQQVCSCNAGYRPSSDDNTKCVDINECSESTHLCSQKCNNIAGSYKCSCISGYTLAADNLTCTDANECNRLPNPCNTTIGETCFNLAGSFKCECNSNQGLILINGTCQVPQPGQDIRDLPETPPTPTQTQIDNSVQLLIANFQSDQWDRQRDTSFRRSVADVLTRYCNVNASRREECGLSGDGIVFSELNINRLPNQPVADGDGTSITFYAVYPNGTMALNNVPVPKSVLLNALREGINDIKEGTGGLQVSVPDEVPVEEDDGLDLALILGVTIGAALVLVSALAVGFMVYGRTHGYPKVVGMEQSIGHRRWSLSGLDTDFTISGETYQGFDDDGLPIDIESEGSIPY